MGNVSTRHHRSKGHRHHYRHHHTKRHHQHRTKKHHKGGQSSPLNPNKKSSSGSLKTKKRVERDNLSLGDRLLRNKGVNAYNAYSKAKRLESIKNKRTKQFREQKESFLQNKRKSI